MARLINSRYGERAHSLIDSETRDQVCRMIRSGSFVETAAAHAGIARSTLHAWLRRGRSEIDRRDHLDDVRGLEAAVDPERQRDIRIEERDRREERDRLNDEKTETEQPYVDFVMAVDTAIAESEMADLSVINKAAYGGQIVEKVIVEVDGRKQEILKYAAPDWRAAQWKMERRHRQNWGKGAIEISGPGGKPIEVAATWADAVKDAIARDKKDRTE